MIPVHDVAAIASGRIVRALLRLVRPGGGTALPGLVASRISPGVVVRALRRAPIGLVVVSGSSGKSTTASLVREILERHGLLVLGNRRTANIPHGIAAELLPQIDLLGRSGADVAVLEVDEGYAASIAAAVPARVTVLLNVMIDQLHRWQEPELVADYLRRAATATSGTLVVDADDPHVAAIGRAVEAAGGAQPAVRRFGMSAAARAALPHSPGSAPDHAAPPAAEGPAPDAVVEAVDGRTVLLRTDRGSARFELPGRGTHVATDAAAAIEAAAAVLGDAFDEDLARSAVSGAPAVFGREETVEVRGVEVDLVLTKSPATMQANIDLLDGRGGPTMVAVGRDIFDTSQLWLVDWSALRHVEVVSGWQTWDTALRLAYDEVEVDRIDDDLDRAVLDHLAAPAPAGARRRIVMTPESMRAIRRRLRLDRLNAG